MSQSKQSTLLLVGVNHTTAPIEVRERLAIPTSRLGRCHADPRASAWRPRGDDFFSTCNRVEFFD